MPIRMEEDAQDPKRRPENQPKPPSSNSNFPLVSVLLGILAVIIKPKLFVPVALILAAYFLFLHPGENYSSETVQYEYEAGTDLFSFGAELNEQEYDKALVFEPLAVGSTNLPSIVNLEQYSPRILHQGSQGSCSGWASAYAARTVSYSQATNQNPDDVAFSPSFLYNQIALPRCQGAYLRDGMEAMVKIGSLPFREFGYTDQTCQIFPDNRDQEAASLYRIKGYNRLSQGASNYSTDIQGIKQHLAQGAPVVIGMMVGQSFQNGMIGKKVWNPTSSDYRGLNLGGHAMCVIGYDDQYQGGAFRIMNSWGPRWGDNGYVWIKYDDFNHFTKEAYGLFPEGQAQNLDEKRLEVKFALVDNNSQSIIPLIQAGEIVFRTESPLRIGSKFKLAITNSVECYTYIFGMDTDGSSYVLFPYTDKHSPFCGIKGTRLFPKDYSMTPDQTGNKDYIAIVVSKKPLDFDAVNRRMNRSNASGYMMRMVESLVDDFVPECEFDVDGSVYFNCDIKDRSLLGVIVEIDKI